MTPDPDASDNSASFTVTASPTADISVTKVAAPDPVVAGQKVTWTATVANAGPSNAAGVVFTDPLPPGVDAGDRRHHAGRTARSPTRRDVPARDASPPAPR